ncbi:helicase C-terminal domain-containing protein [Piscibacillus halophilus]|uniref:3'-5' exonuclease DinG n=1 Tax=Piscibacillus halophilus TaxID=571933 RepID=A0A1H8ZRE5_9BACI|nr:helicase C-terminal domain-containing protein [Piscibacillus halophilus]SEP66914.1 ATP-dependent DNA helicase DinG [Piscibacillus halophilus]
MNRYVVVDLETTGHSVKKGDEIIEIGLVVIENQKIIQEYSTKVKPKQDIPPFITRLTGITDEDVSNAPTFEEIIPEILPFFEDVYFVAHQVQFDYNFLNEAFEQHRYDPLQLPIIDTVELSRVLYPRADSFKLEDITSYLNIEHYSPHRALSDAYVTGLLFIKLVNKLENLPFETLNQLQPLTRVFNGDIEQIIEDLIQYKRYKRDPYSITFENGFAVRTSMNKSVTPIPGLTSLSLNEFLGNWSDDQLKLRESQIKMSHQINQSFLEKRHAVIEAETGIGKTLSYLLVALYQAQSHQKKTLISTSTIQLQHQILSRDWMKVETLLNTNQSIAVLKSPMHYIHLNKLRFYLEEIDDYNYDTALSLAIILVWLTETQTGDKDEIQLPSKGEDIWPYISGVMSNEDEEQSSYFKRALVKARNASVIIVNHAFLITEHVYRSNRIPEYDYLIIDEAHRLQDVVQKQLGRQIDYVSIAHVLNNIESLTHHTSVERLKHSIDQFFRSIYQAVLFLHSEKDALSDTGKVQLPLDQYHLDIILSGHLKQQLNDVLLDLEQVTAIVKQNTYYNNWKKVTKQKILDDLEDVKTTLKSFFKYSETDARWIDIDQDGAKNAVQLNIEPINVQEFIQQNVINNEAPTVLMSATIRTNHSFESFLEEIGLSENTNCLYLPSPYDYHHQVRLYVPNDFPDIKQISTLEYEEEVASFVMTLIEELEEKAIVLFTSYEMLKSVYKMLKVMDRQQKIPILAQGVQTGSREKLKKLFEKTDKAILLGTSSFWEGIDIHSQSVKIVIMVRLPFDTPNHPMFQAKSKQLEEENKNAFYHWMLPQAVLRFRQAFGRLIRSEEDRGLFIVLDQRIMTKHYGKQFLKAIPEVPLLHDRRHQLLTDAKNWLSYNADKDE